MSVVGDPLTFRPVTSSIVRKSKQGDVNVVIMLFGTHYNVKMDGVLQQDTEGDIDNNTITVSDSKVHLAMQREAAGSGVAEQIATFSSFMYFYPGLKIRGHLQLDETSHVVTVPELEGHYHFKDLLSSDELVFKLTRLEDNLLFEMAEVVSAVETVLYSENLAVGADEIYFEFVYLENGKSKFYIVTDYKLPTQTISRKWVGDLTAKIGECNVTLHHHNEEEVIHTVSSDLLFIEYPQIFLKFDRNSTDRFIGNIRVYDTDNELLEADWIRVRSRDHKFTGDRVIENGLIRLVIPTSNPEIEIWGWNSNAGQQWERTMRISPESDTGILPLKIQNVVIEYFKNDQINCEFNFGTSVYQFLMTRGDPYITMLNKGKTKFNFRTAKDRFIGDFSDPLYSYTLENSSLGGTPLGVKATGTVVLSDVLAGDTLTVNGLVYTAVAGAKANNTQFSIDGSDTVDAADLADSITNDTRTPVTVPNIDVTATSVTFTITITATSAGIDGNSIDMSDTGGVRITPSGATLSGGADTGGPGSESLTGFTLLDNWFAVYNHDATDEVVGWISNIAQPSQIDIDDVNPDLRYTFTYPLTGNVIAIGVLPGFPNILAGKVPTPFAVGTQDKYVKWPANEAVLAFKEQETIKRR
jgi:hypothetical protein